jgi:hypothetical protein
MRSQEERDVAKPEAVRIGGRDVSEVMAALMAQEADRLGVLPGELGELSLPDPVPATVRISGFEVSIGTGAAIAKAADELRLHPKRLIEKIVEEHAEARARRARRRSDSR